MGASDIHVEPFEKELQVRYRVDGILQLFNEPYIVICRETRHQSWPEPLKRSIERLENHADRI